MTDDTALLVSLIACSLPGIALIVMAFMQTPRSRR